MARPRPSLHHAGPRALATALACIVLAVVVLRFDVADGLTVPAWTVAVPFLLYAAITILTLGRASLRRRAVWLAGACATHAVFVVTTAALVAATGSMSLGAALPHAIVEAPLATVVFIIGVPLTLLPFRGRLLERPAVRAAAPRPAVPAAPAAPVAERIKSAPLPGETPFAREARRRTEAARAAAEAAASVESAAAADAAPAAPAAPVVDAAPIVPPPVVLPPPARPVVAPMPIRAADEETVRIPFERIAAQLPAEAFVLPVERLGESLRSPHELLVPRSLVVEQLGEGRVDVAWTLVADQFPTLSFALETSEMRRRYPDLRLSLPLDLVLPQLPPGLFAGAASVEQPAGLERYPAPFQPSAAAPAPAVPTPATITEAPVVVERPAILPPVSTPPAVASAEPPPPPPEETRAPAPARAAVVAPPAPAALEAPPPALLAEGHRLAARLSAFGPLEVAAQRVNGTTVLSLVTAKLPHEAIERAAARCAPLLSAAQQVTIHAERASMVLRPVRGGVLVVGLRAGSPLALLEILVGRACGEGAMAAAPAGTPRGLAAADVDGRVAALRGALGGFGDVQPAAFVDRTNGLDVYVFSAGAETAQDAGEAARVVWQALVRESEGDLGRAVSVVLREGSRRTVVHPVAAARRPAMLAAAGVLTLPGLAYRQAAQAAERLATV